MVEASTSVLPMQAVPWSWSKHFIIGQMDTTLPLSSSTKISPEENWNESHSPLCYWRTAAASASTKSRLSRGRGEASTNRYLNLQSVSPLYWRAIRVCLVRCIWHIMELSVLLISCKIGSVSLVNCWKLCFCEKPCSMEWVSCANGTQEMTHWKG